MNLKDIRLIAKQHHLKPDGSTKIELVRKIQQMEGNFDCYASASLGICDQSACRWRQDCFADAAQPAP